MKKRFWFEEVYNEKQANFVWTQIKRNSIFKRQQNGEISMFAFNKTKRKDELSKGESLKRILNAEELKEINIIQDSARTRGLDNF